MIIKWRWKMDWRMLVSLVNWNVQLMPMFGHRTITMATTNHHQSILFQCRKKKFNFKPTKQVSLAKDEENYYWGKIKLIYWNNFIFFPFLHRKIIIDWILTRETVWHVVSLLCHITWPSGIIRCVWILISQVRNLGETQPHINIRTHRHTHTASISKWKSFCSYLFIFKLKTNQI